MIELNLQFFGGRGSSGNRGFLDLTNAGEGYFEHNGEPEWRKELSSSERNDIHDYTSGKEPRSGDAWFKLINDSLRAGFSDYDIVPQAKGLDSAINKFDLKDNIVVYRSSDFNASNLKIGDTISDEGYLSTSIDPETALAFEGKTLFRIEVPKGKGRGASVYHLSDIPTEQEFLLKRGARMRVVGTGSYTDSEGEKHKTINLRMM